MWTAVVVIAVGLVTVFGAMWWARGEAIDRCQFSVRSREDTRAMWEYLVGQNPDNPKVPEFVVEMDRLIPRLKCEGSRPVPIGDSE